MLDSEEFSSRQPFDEIRRAISVDSTAVSAKKPGRVLYVAVS